MVKTKMSGIDFKQLEADGYCIVRNFLNCHTIELLKKDYASITPTRNPNYTTFLTEKKPFVEDLLGPVLKDITNNTNIKVDILNGVGGFWNSKFTGYGWHQDSEAYYLYQNAYNALNFWLPIIKPVSNKSGLSIVPHSALSSRFPALFATRIKGKGAKKFSCLDNITVITDGEVGDKITLDINLNDLAYSPELSPGDLLLMRQDIIHKTQDVAEDRVAFSIRAYSSDSILDEDKFLFRCPTKHNFILNNPHPYKNLEDYFKSCHTKQVRLGDFIRHGGYIPRAQV
jgi:hypothetical protein